MKALRAGQSRLKFAKSLGLSYTFVREMELGNRLPSDDVLLALAARLQVDPRRLLICAYCDRSPMLRSVLRGGDIAELMATLLPEEKSETP